MTTCSMAPARNTNVWLINVPWGTGEMGGGGSWEAPEVICHGIQEVTLCLDPRPALVPTRYGARERVFICLDLFM